MRPKRGRISLREQKEKVNAALAYYGIPLRNEIAPKRTRRAAGSDGRPLERDILKAVMKALRLDHRVASVERNQSGVFQDGNRYIRVGSKGKLDLTVYLKTGRYLELEVKRDRHAHPTREQMERIDSIKRSGGLAGWCWSVESALACLP